MKAKILALDHETAFWEIEGHVYRCSIEVENDASGLPSPRKQECSIEKWNQCRTTVFADFTDACPAYEEDGAICDSQGEPKGQCVNCGGKWFWHANVILPSSERKGVNEIRRYQARIRRERSL